MRLGRAAMLLVAIVATTHSMPGGAQSSKVRSADAATEAMDRERALWDMLKRKDFRAFDAAVDGMTFVGATGVVPQWKPGLAEAFFKTCTLAKYTLDSIQTRTRGPNLVVLSYKATVDQTCGGVKAPSPTYETAVWQRVGTEWKVLYGGSTPLAGK